MNTQWTEITALAAELGAALRERGWRLATAESCTGGLASGALTSVAGSSDWFLGGVVSYANSVKAGLLGVPEAVLAAHGAVSGPVVLAMAAGACRALRADAALAVSGVAGPGGGTPAKPVGTVWMAWAWPGGEAAERFHFQGDREAVRLASVAAALAGLLARVRDAGNVGTVGTVRDAGGIGKIGSAGA